jgi:alpha-L-fucosidase 2
MNIEELTQHDMTVWYAQPAEHWFDGLPLANGRIGAMVYGGARVERLYLTETTFWSGEPSSENNNPQGPAIFRQVRKHLLARDIQVANHLARELEGRKLNYGTNLPFGNLRLLFNQIELHERDYRRELNLDEGLVHIQYRVGEVVFQREMFLSAPHQALVIRLTASRPGALTFRAVMDGDEQPYSVRSEGNDTLLLDTQARETQHSDGTVGVDGHARLRVLAEGGAVQTTATQLIVTNATSVTIFLALGTTFAGGQPQATSLAQIEAAAALPYEELRRAHISDHQSLFRRCALNLGENPHPDWPIDRRLDAVRQGVDDPHLCALLFQWGRYLLIGSSHPDSPLPAHLTGAWNDNKACRIDWTCDYHLDINTQMNYWIAELSGLSECVQPLIRWIQGTLVPSGRETAHKLYGLPGWVAHIFSNPWGFTAWGWSTWWGVFPTGGVWVAMHLWDHYCFSGDSAFLRDTAYPILKEAAEFCLAYLVEDPQTGWLVSGPANSPENAFRWNSQPYPVALGPTVDRVLIKELFDACIQAGETLSLDVDFLAHLTAARSRLPPYQIGQYGQIQEWLEDYEEAVPGHRHTSHLLGLFPFAQIAPRTTPELARAARVSIERRVSAPGYEEGGWARNNISLFFARLGDGEAAYQSLSTLFHKEAGDSLFTGTRLAPANAYELDYNTGAAAAIAEMLLQSHTGCLEFLPALPLAWPEGQVRGLRARGGFEVTLRWANHRLEEAAILSHHGGVCQIANGKGVTITLEGSLVPVQPLAEEVISFETQAGKVYRITNSLA